MAPDRAATCAHVVRPVGEGGKVSIAFDGTMRSASVLKVDEESDSAILTLDEPLKGVEPLELAGGCKLKAVWDGFGFPGVGRKAGLPLTGEVMEPDGKDDRNVPVLVLYSPQIAAGMAAPIHGFSGSPVMVEDVVVGHLKRIIPDPGSDPQRPRPAFGLVYATPAVAVARLLGVNPSVSVVQPPEPHSPIALLPTLKDGEYHVFVSYQRSNEKWAKELARRLGGDGFRVFIDQRELLPGDQLANALQAGLSRCRAAVVLMSKEWLGSKWCQEEANVLLQRAVQEPEFRLVPLKIDDCTPPALFQARIYLDFVGRSGPEGRDLIRLQYALLGRPAPEGDASEDRVHKAETEATDELVRAVRAAAAAGPQRVFALWKQWHGAGMPDGPAALCAAESLVKLARPELALSVLESAKPGIRASQLRALALSKCKRIDEAIEILVKLRQSSEDAETLGLLAGRYKQKWVNTEQQAFLIAAFEVYVDAFGRTGDSYPGINVASLALQLGRRAESARTAQKVLDALDRVPPAELARETWLLATKGEAFLLGEDLPNAKIWYGRAVAINPMAVQDIAVMRQGARMDLKALGQPEGTLDSVLSVPRAAAFTGHMVDLPGRATPRFPPEKVGAVRREMREQLKRLQVSFGFSSAARGSDLIFLEELLARGGAAQVFLPFPAEDFIRTSVGTDWETTFRSVLAHKMVEPKLLSDQLPPEHERPAAYLACSQAVHQKAADLAELLDDREPLLICVWDGKQGDGAGGTADAVRAWKDQGYEAGIVTIDISKF